MGGTCRQEEACNPQVNVDVFIKSKVVIRSFGRTNPKFSSRIKGCKTSQKILIHEILRVLVS
jgi:hypothetical protein